MMKTNKYGPLGVIRAKLEELDLSVIAHHERDGVCVYCALPITEKREGGICYNNVMYLAKKYECSPTWVIKVLTGDSK